MFNKAPAFIRRTRCFGGPSQYVAVMIGVTIIDAPHDKAERPLVITASSFAVILTFLLQRHTWPIAVGVGEHDPGCFKSGDDGGDDSGRGGGLACAFGVQALINMGVAVRLLPAKGMTLPFVSYGGSSVIASGITLGMLLALTRTRPQNALADVLGRAGR